MTTTSLPVALWEIACATGCILILRIALPRSSESRTMQRLRVVMVGLAIIHGAFLGGALVNELWIEAVYNLALMAAAGICLGLLTLRLKVLRRKAGR